MGFLRNSIFLAVVIVPAAYYINKLLIPPPVMSGETSSSFRPVAHLFKNLIKDGTERGASLAVFHKGEPVVNLVGGYADTEFRRPWTQDTLTYAMSIAKAGAALCFAMLYDKGVFKYDEPVSKYWPEFAVNGKEKITIGQLLAHQAGLFVLDRSLKVQEIVNNEPIVSETLANQKPNKIAGNNPVYHALTFGLYVDQLLRRLDPKKRSVQKFFSEEITKPLSVEVYYGLPKYQFYRLARLQDRCMMGILHNLVTLDYDKLMIFYRIAFNELSWNTSMRVLDWEGFPNALMSPEVAQASLVSTHLITTAFNLGRVFSVFSAGGTVGEHKLLKPSTIQLLMKQVSYTLHDFNSYFEARWSYGFSLHKMPLGSIAIGHIGFGNQFVLSDPDHNVTIAYLTNNFHPESYKWDPIVKQILDTVYDVIKTEKAKGNKEFL